MRTGNDSKTKCMISLKYFAVIKFGKNTNDDPKDPPLAAQQSCGHLNKAYDRVVQNFGEATSKFWAPFLGT
jgi:hypothetical protein